MGSRGLRAVVRLRPPSATCTWDTQSTMIVNRDTHPSNCAGAHPPKQTRRQNIAEGETHTTPAAQAHSRPPPISTMESKRAALSPPPKATRTQNPIIKRRIPQQLRRRTAPKRAQPHSSTACFLGSAPSDEILVTLVCVPCPFLWRDQERPRARMRGAQLATQ